MKQLLLSCFLLIYLGVFGQSADQREIDSLIQVANSDNEDTTIAKALNKLAWKFMFNQPDTALKIAVHAIKVAKRTDDPELLINAINEKGTAFGVQGMLDSAELSFKYARNEATKVKDHNLLSIAYNNLGLIYWNQGRLDSAIASYNMAVKHTKQSGKNVSNLANIYNNLGLIHKNRGSYELAIDVYKKALFIFDSLEKKNRGVANTINNLGILYFEKGDLPNAMDHYLKALKMYEDIEDKSDGHANALSNIGNIYKEQKEYKKSIEYYNRAKELFSQISDQSVGYATTLNSLGSVYQLQKKYDQATKIFKEALQMQESMGKKTNGMANTLTNLGKIEEHLGNISTANVYFKDALGIQEEIGDKKGIANSLFYLGRMEVDQGNIKLGIDLCEESYEIADELDLVETLRNACNCLYNGYDQSGNIANAFKYYKLFVQSKDSLINKENTREITQKAMQYEFDKIQYQDSLNRAEEAKRQELIQREKDLKKEAELHRQKVYAVSGIAGFILMLGLAFVLFRGYKNKQKANQIISAQKREVEAQKLEVEAQKEAVEEQKSIIEEKNNEIVDSITYAKRIQNTILPSNELITSLLPNSFVFFRPKDIVSGDFYWVDKTDDYVFFASVDCTGHGVPGALVSVVGYNGLNRVLKEYKIYEPAAMLDQLNLIVEETFSKTTDSIRDGMDIAICRLDLKNMELQFAGANNPLYIVRDKTVNHEDLAEKSSRNIESEDGKYQLFEVKGDKQPIGKYDFRMPFSNHKVSLEKEDGIYIFSDGFADQFGGEKGKKFMYKPFKRLLASIANVKPVQQLDQIKNVYDSWKGDMEQIDDVCVFGVKI